jgi:hypothetical protein
VLLIALALGLTGGAPVMSSSAAYAATYNGTCGSGYGVIDSIGVSGGTVFLTYNGATGNNCVTTVRNSPGGALPMIAAVKLSSSSTWNYDSGYYTTYAGPVYVYAPHACIDWGGGINGDYRYVYSSHCG